MKVPEEAYPKVYLYRRIVQAKLFIDKHYPEKIDLNNISESAYFSKYHFIRIFKKIYRKTPHQYLISVRMMNAKQLLKTGHSITDVCYSVGFESPGSFTELFKREVGTNPSSYQAQYQKLIAEARKTPLKFVPNCYAESNSRIEKSNFR